jgi:hypothetical protein
MENKWTQEKIQQMIDDGEEESLTLDYKGADSLAKTDKHRTEITKDVSAMANSAGGIILYGVKEFDSKAKRHAPEKIEPVSRTDFSKEWLEHVINNIRPKVERIFIYPVNINTSQDDVVYVVEIPQSSTAHQSMDKKYYKRFNFESAPMDDYEIRDVMHRHQYPKIELDYKLDISSNVFSIGLKATNKGQRLAKYIHLYILIPHVLIPTEKRKEYEHVDETYSELHLNNTVRDIVDYQVAGFPPKYGTSWFQPILPNLAMKWTVQIVQLWRWENGGTDMANKIIFVKNYQDLIIKWKIYADDAPQREGQITLGDILDKQKIA